MQKVFNNVVPQDKMREIQGNVLRELASILTKSFGPMGSNACIKKENALSRYSKDGHTIISALHYNGIIEQSIKDDVESISRHIVKTVGDGTTSAIILSSMIFDHFCKIEKDNPDYKPAEFVKTMQRVVDRIKEKIKSDYSRDMTLNDVYDIAMISTNGNEYVSATLLDIYKEFGMEVFIDVTPSTGEDFVIKSYNGMTLNSGYCDSCYVTNSKNNTSEIDHPEVYFFEHPIDTRELGAYLDAILYRNIIDPINSNEYDRLIPTVIFAPMISQDMSGVMDSLTSTMAKMPVNNRLPICIITDLHEPEQLADLVKMCGGKTIRKYIDANIYKADVERGDAPTPETVFNWAGTCDKVIAYSDKTTFIRPSKMYNEDGEHSEIYNNLVAFLETEIANATSDGEDPRTIGTLKRRLHSLKSNMVELFVGGITQADRDSLRDLVEDAVLNIRSAAKYGVGYGANMGASCATFDVLLELNEDPNLASSMDFNIASSIFHSYDQLLGILYNGIKVYDDNDEIKPTPIQKCKLDHEVFNIRTNKWDTNVVSSVMSDIIILDTVCKIIGIMVTCNQFILPTAMHNIYTE